MKRLILFLIFIFLLYSCSKKENYNIFILSIDTWRADYLSYYNKNNVNTPNLDEIAKNGVYFENAYTVVPITTPSHSTIFTGLYPFSHGVRSNGGFKIPENIKTITEFLKEKGYQTGGFVGAFPLDRQFGFSKGFDVYDDDIKPKPFSLTPYSAERRAEEVADKAIEWMNKIDKKKPFFLFVHFYDPHHPYSPPDEYQKKYKENPYSGEVSYCDEQAGRIFDFLKESKLYKKTIIIFLGDHGESLGEHGELTHMIFIYDSTLHIPLAISGPKIPKGKRIKEEVSLVDLLPTILKIAEIDLPKYIQGKDLSLLWEGNKKPKKRFLYSESFLPKIQYHWAPLQSLREYPYKYIKAPEEEFYDLEKDPKEQNNIYKKDKNNAERFKKKLEIFLKENKIEKIANIKLDKESIQKLQSLGYIGGFGEGFEESFNEELLPDPKEKIHIFNEFENSLTILASGKAEEAKKERNKILEKYPEELWINLILGRNLLDQKKYYDLLDILKINELEKYPPKLRASILLLRIEALNELKNFREALEELKYLEKYKKSESSEFLKIKLNTYLNMKDFKSLKKVLENEKIKEEEAFYYKGLCEIIEGKEQEGYFLLKKFKEFIKSTKINERDPRLKAAEFLIDFDKAKARFILKNIIEEEKNTSEAIEAAYLLSTIEANAKNELVQLLKDSRKEMEEKDFESAIKSLKKIIEYGSNSVEVYYDLAVCYQYLNKIKEAKEALIKAIEIDKTFAPALVDLAFLYEKEGNIKEAINYYQNCLFVAQDYYPLLTRYGVLLSRLGKHEMAIKLLYRALNNAPDRKVALNNLVVALFNAGRNEEAKEIIAKEKLN